MVLLNMGGPSTVDEVEDFLTRLFVSGMRFAVYIDRMLTISRLMAISSPSDVSKDTLAPSYQSGERPRSRNNMLPLAEALPFESGQSTRQMRCARFWTGYHRRRPLTSRT